MKILMVLESDYPPDIRVENEIASLLSAGHELHVACYSYKKVFQVPDDLPYSIHKIHISPLVYKASVGALKSGIYFRFWRKFLLKLFKGHSFDAIHIHDLPLARLGYEMGQKYGIPFILDLHENWPALLKISQHTNTFLGKLLSSNAQWVAYEKKYVSWADKVIVVVDEAKERIGGLGVDPSRIHVVSNTINPDHFNFPKQEKDGEHFTLVYGGGINYHRGLQTVISALPEIALQVPNVKLWIIGKGSYVNTLKMQASELDMNNYIEFHDWMPLQDLLKRVSKSDVALIPHIKSAHTDSTVPHKLFQYMYAGIPTLASECDPLQRILLETSTGIVFKDQDPKDFASKLFRLMHDSYFREHIPVNGRNWVEKKYNWNADAEVLVSIYRKLDC